MKSDKPCILTVGTGLVLMLLSSSVWGAELTPTLAQPDQKTPPAVSAQESTEAELKLPPAVPLEELTDSKMKAPAVAAKKAQPTPEAFPKVEPPAQPVETTKAKPEAISAEPEQAREVAVKLELPTGRAIPTVSTPLRPADKKAVARAEKQREEEGVYFNVSGEDIREIIKQISRVTGKNFILGDKVRGEVTIISEQKLTKEELYEAFLSALDVAGYTTVPGPAGLIRIVKQRNALSSPIPIYTEKTPYTSRFITRLLTLKNIKATDMANAIKGLISKEGNLFAYPSTNTLIITDSGTNIDRLVKLVNELDTEGPQEVLEIIPIEYADVKDIEAKVTKLFGGEGTSARPTRRRPTARRGKAADTSPEAVPTINKIIADERTNSLIILASKITIAKVRSVIRRLDTPLIGPEEGDIHVLYLKNAKASDIAEVLTGVTQAVQKAQKDAKKGATRRSPAVPKEAFEGLFGSIKSIKADDDTNALIIQANAKDFRTLIDRIISKLDIPRRQVYIEATIMEVGVRKGLELGTGILGGKVFGIGGTDLALFGNTFPFIPGITTTSSVGGATIDNPIAITPPFSDNPLNFPKFFAAFVAQADDAELNILSTPNILTLDNAEARIKVGDTIPFLTGNALTTGGVQTSNVQREDVVLELVVTPQITEGDNVRMKIKQTIEDFSEATNPLEAMAGPATTIREIESEVVVPDRQTVVLGGLMQDRSSSRKSRIPLLGDIPILGYLFKGTSHSKRKVNLLVFLTPNIIREPQDFLKVLQEKIEQRNRFIDENFGKRGRKRIRETIARHNERLLDFQAATSPLSQPEILPTAPVQPATEQESKPKEVGVAPKIAAEPPISTASEPAVPPAKPSESEAEQAFGTMPSDIDLAF